MENHNGVIWKDFIRSGIAPARLLSQMSESADIASYVEMSGQARDEFMDSLLAEAASCKDETQLRGIVMAYQALVCFLLNQVQGYLQTSRSRTEWTALYEAVTVDLDASLQFIQDYFPRYFDGAAFVPKSRLTALHEVIQRTGVEIKQTLDRSTHDLQLNELLMLEMQKLSKGQISFRQLSYLYTFLAGLSTTIESRAPLWLRSHLATYCIVKNFNASVVLEQLFSSMTEMLSSLDTAEAKKEWLLAHQKQLYNYPLDQELSLHDNRPTVRDHLITWIEQEMQSWNADQKRETTPVPDSVSKIHTSVSVPVLALLTRVMKESGIITNANLQEVFRFVSTHYTSQRKETISPGNFHGKYYTVEESTKRKVTDLLLEMVKAIRKIP